MNSLTTTSKKKSKADKTLIASKSEKLLSCSMKIPTSQPSELFGRVATPAPVPTHFSDVASLKFKHSVETIAFPRKVLYYDFCGKFGLSKLDLKNWNVYPLVFRHISPSCTYLYLDNCHGVDVESLQIIRGHKQLKRLSLSGTKCFVDSVMGQVFGSFKMLLSINVSGCHVNTEALRMIGLNCESVNSFVAAKAEGIDNFGLHAIGQWIQRFRTLQSLDLSDTKSDFGDDGILDIMTVGFNILTAVDISGCKQLTSLCIAGLRSKMSVLTSLNLQKMNLRQSAFEWITEGCKGLVELDLSRSAELDDVALSKIGRSCWSLTSLNVSNCLKVTDKGVVGFMSRFEGQLEVIDISGCIHCGSASTEAIASRGALLRIIHMNGLSRVSSAALIALWSAASKTMVVFQMCCELRSVTMHRKSMMPHFDDEVLLQAEYGARLEEVELTGACLVTDRGACELIRRAPRLRVLNLSYCNAVTDRTLVCVAAGLPQLENLNTGGCIKITSAGLIALGSGVCKNITKLDFTGSAYIQDPGLKALGGLKKLTSLSIRGLDFVTDDGLTVLARNCRHLHHLEMTGLDLVTVRALKQIIRYCESLTVLNCETCAFTPGEFAATVGKKLPFAKAANAKCKLDIYPAPLINYNHYVQQLRVKDQHARTLQRFAKNMLATKWQLIVKQTARKRLKDMRNVFHAMRLVIKKDGKDRAKFMKNRAATRLQQLMRRLMAVHLARRRARHLRVQQRARICIQSHFRGYRTRKRTYWVFKRLYYFYSKIGHLAHKLLTITAARHTHRLLLATQAFARMVPVRAAFWRCLAGIIELQRRVRFHLDGGRAAKLEAAEQARLRAILVQQNAAARVIQKNWKGTWFNKCMSPYILTCCIWWRSDWDERLWNSIVIQRYFRGHSVRLKDWKRKKALTIRDDSALLIQKNYRGYVTRCWHATAGPHMRRVLAGWKLFFIYAKPKLRLGRYCKRIQRFRRLYCFICQRIDAALEIERVYRGLKGRKRALLVSYSNKIKDIEKIQHQWYCYRQRKRREFRAARRHMAAYKIEALIDSIFEIQRAKQRVIDARLREKEQLTEMKKRALFDRRSLVVEKIASDYRNRMARRIQRMYAAFKTLKAKKEAQKAIEDAAAAEEALLEEEANRARTKPPPPRKGLAAAVVGPLKKFAEVATEVKDTLLGSSQLIPPKEFPKFRNAVLRYQVKGILQKGVVEIQLTMGEVETHAFEATQAQLKLAGLPYYVMIKGDLSGVLELGIMLWAMYGEGNECITKLVVAHKPQMSVVALGTRKMNKRLEGIKIAWHEFISFEIQGWCTIKQGLGDFAVSDIVLTESLQEEDIVQRNSNMVLCQDMGEFGLRSTLWVETRVIPEEDNMHKLGAMEGKYWFDERLHRLIKAFILSEADVYSMHSVFEDIRRDRTQAGRKNIRVDDLFRYIDYQYTKLAKWVVIAVNPASKFELSFSEYVHVISFYCMLIGNDLQKFIFMNADDANKQYLRYVVQ